jgi:hypothetical protein
VSDAPVLIIAFNRPELTKKLIASLRPSQPKTIIFAVDGPRAGRDIDAERVRETQGLVAEFDWNCKLETIFRPTNLGLRFAVADAVSFATSKYGKVIVVEDDIEVGSSFIDYMQNSLVRYDLDQEVAHINGYAVVPPQYLQYPDADRKTRYIESLAWATRERSWVKYDEDLSWAKSVSLKELSSIVGSYVAAVRWKQILNDASKDLINTWAYRWMATIWSHGWSVISPPQNLVRYMGAESGTHTRRRPRWTELQVRDDVNAPQHTAATFFDVRADQWIGKNIFEESITGLCKGMAVTALLGTVKKWNSYASK